MFFRIVSYFFITSLCLMIGCSVPKPKPKPRDDSKSKYIPKFLIPKPTRQSQVVTLSFVGINGKSIPGVEFESEVDLLGSIEDEKLLETKKINKISDNSGKIDFQIFHPIIETNSGYSTYTFVSFTASKDGYIDKSGSFDIQHSEPFLTKDYLTKKLIDKNIIIFEIKDFINNSFELYSKKVKIEYDDIENCIKTFAEFPSTYGELKTGSVKITKNKGKYSLEFGFNSSVDNNWLLGTYKSIGRRMRSSLFDSDITIIRLRINGTTTYTISTESLSKYLDREYSDSKFLKKIKKG